MNIVPLTPGLTGEWFHCIALVWQSGKVVVFNASDLSSCTSCWLTGCPMNTFVPPPPVGPYSHDKWQTNNQIHRTMGQPFLMGLEKCFFTRGECYSSVGFIVVEVVKKGNRFSLVSFLLETAIWIVEYAAACLTFYPPKRFTTETFGRRIFPHESIVWNMLLMFLDEILFTCLWCPTVKQFFGLISFLLEKITASWYSLFNAYQVFRVCWAQ